MKIAFVAAFLMLSLFASAADPQPAAWPEEPKDYRGLPFGATEQEVSSKLKLDLEVSCQTIDERRSCIHHGTIGDVRAMEIYQFDEDQLVQVDILFKPDRYSALRDVFVERYGEPTETWTEPFETVGGGDHTTEISEWRGDRMFVQIVQFGSSLQESAAVITTREWYEQTAEE
jgi:hypothetical protein